MAAVVGAYSSPRSGSMANGFAHWSGIGGLLHTQAVVGILFLAEWHDVVGDGPLAMGHLAVGVLEQAGVAEPLGAVLLGVVGAVVVPPPRRLGAVQRGAGCHLGTHENTLHFT